MIYFCIPVHNEEKTAGVVLWKIRQVMAEFPRDYQILLADDGSTDGTAQVLDPYRRVLPLVLLRSRQRRGYAAALEMLVREAARRSRYPRRDVVVTLQADFSDDAEFAPALLRRMESGADIAVGGPITAGARPGFVERTTDRIARRLLRRMAWPEPVADPLNGFTAIRLACIRRALEEQPEGRLLRWDGRAANAALLAAAAPHARRIDAIEMTTYPERRTRASRARPLARLREVHRFVRGIPGRGLVAVEALVPDEVHGDLSALRPDAGEPRPEPRDRAPRRRKSAAGEQREERARKDGKPRRPRRAAGSSARPAGAAAAGPDAATPEQGTPAGEPARKRSRGTRGGSRSRRKPVPKEGGAATAGAEPEDRKATPSQKTRGGAPQDPGTESADGAPRKRRRRGRRGRGGQKPGGSSAGNGEAGPDTNAANEPDRRPAESDGA